MEEKKEFKSTHTKTQRTLAWIGIVLLIAMTVIDFVFAVSGAPNGIFMGAVVLTIFIPIVLYFFILMLKKKHPDNEDIKVPGSRD